MRMAWFLSLTYIAGIDGFRFFVPYLLGVGMLSLFCRRMPKRAPATVTETSAADARLELEPAAA